jgi:hypothetical protein
MWARISEDLKPFWKERKYERRNEGIIKEIVKLSNQ